MATYIHGLDDFRDQTNSQHQEAIKLRVIVVGGGVAGLSVALSFRLYGHDVTVLERSTEYEAIDVRLPYCYSLQSLTLVLGTVWRNTLPSKHDAVVQTGPRCLQVFGR